MSGTAAISTTVINRTECTEKFDPVTISSLMHPDTAEAVFEPDGHSIVERYSGFAWCDKEVEEGEGGKPHSTEMTELPIKKSDWSVSAVSLGTAMADLTGIGELKLVFDDRDNQYDPMRVAVNCIIGRCCKRSSTLREVLASGGFCDTFLDTLFRSTDSFDNCELEQCVRIVLHEALVNISGQGVFGAAQLLKSMYAHLNAGSNGFPLIFQGFKTNQFFEAEYGRVMLHSGPPNACSFVDALREALGFTSQELTEYHMYFHSTSWVDAENIAEEGIDVTAERSDKDFGYGFYVSESLHFASVQACRIYSYQPAVVVYVAKRDWLEGHEVLNFFTTTTEWQKLTKLRKVVARTSAYEAIVGPIVNNPFYTGDHLSISYDGIEQQQTCIVTQALADELNHMRTCVLFFPQGCTPECLFV